MVYIATQPKAYPFYSLVPRDFGENLDWRKWALKKAADSTVWQRRFWTMCSRDILFYINAFMWTKDQRSVVYNYEASPFITFDFQNEVIDKIQGGFGLTDILVAKSRDVGMSWISLFCCEHPWHFKRGYSILLCSRKEDLVDKPGNEDSLFWKIDFFQKLLPKWLMPPIIRMSRHLRNLRSTSVIEGESTNADLARGGRRTVVFMDEMAAMDKQEEIMSSLLYVTESRLMVSSVKGPDNSFAKQSRKGLPTIQVRCHWTSHPLQRRGMYTTTDGQIEIIDKSYDFPEDYPFELGEEGAPRSPYYDRKIERAEDPFQTKRELDMDFYASDVMYFDAGLVQAMLELVKEPKHLGVWRDKKFEDFPRGQLSLWFNPSPDGDPPTSGHYVMGIDIAAGTGASNSVISVVDRESKEKVAEFISNRIEAQELARMAMELGAWFNDAFMVFDANGVTGAVFSKRVLSAGYNNLYVSEKEGVLGPTSTKKAGFWATPQTRFTLLEEYKDALNIGALINRSRAAIVELREYKWVDSSKVVHQKSRSTTDPSAQGESHGDIVIADALAFRGLRAAPPIEKDRMRDKVPMNSIGGRRREREKEAKRSKEPCLPPGW